MYEFGASEHCVEYTNFGSDGTAYVFIDRTAACRPLAVEPLTAKARRTRLATAPWDRPCFSCGAILGDGRGAVGRHQDKIEALPDRLTLLAASSRIGETDGS